MDRSSTDSHTDALWYDGPELGFSRKKYTVHNGNLVSVRTAVSDLSYERDRAIEYLSTLRLTGRNVPRNILVIETGTQRIYRIDAEAYRDEIHLKTGARPVNASVKSAEPCVETVEGYLHRGRARTEEILNDSRFVPVDVTKECVVAWAERYYREVPGADKSHLLGDDGEFRSPAHFAGLITPYAGDDWSEFQDVLDQLNNPLSKIELGAYYTPTAYARKAHELLLDAIARVPVGNDYIILDRCAGTGNLERGLEEYPCNCTGPLSLEEHDVLSHCVVNTFERYEYVELLREFGGRVRHVIPPTSNGAQVDGDALSDRFVLGVTNTQTGARVPNAAEQYVKNPRCTTIMMENPPYGESGGIEAQKTARRSPFGWKDSYVKAEMSAAWGERGQAKAVNELSNLFIWSAFRYYLRRPEDSYIVFGPCKYFKSQDVISKKFLRGFLVNRKHFHAASASGISIILWANEPESARTDYVLEAFDIDDRVSDDINQCPAVPGSSDGRAPTAVTVRKTEALLSTLYDNRTFPDDEPGIACEFNGVEAFRSQRGSPIYNDNMIGYLVAQSASFENPRLMTKLTRCAVYNGNGFFLRRDNYLSKLPLFVVGRYPTDGKYWEYGVVNRCADGGEAYVGDREFLKQCLIYTSLSYFNKCLSFTGSDGRQYRNELCFDSDTEAFRALKHYEAETGLTQSERNLLSQWEKVLSEAMKVTQRERHGEYKKVYDPTVPWGLYQIAIELDTTHTSVSARGARLKVPDFPQLHKEIRAIKSLLAKYHADSIAPKLWEHGLLR